MTDLELTQLCAKAVGHVCSDRKYSDSGVWVNWNTVAQVYDPLHDDAQAMALVKKLNMEIERSDTGRSRAWIHPAKECSEWCDELNRAIVECVAKMHKERK